MCFPHPLTPSLFSPHCHNRHVRRNHNPDISRLNGAKSQGPKTPEGKARSSMNAFKHGRYANNAVVLSNEDRGAFDDLVQAYPNRIHPNDPVEMLPTRQLTST